MKRRANVTILCLLVGALTLFGCGGGGGGGGGTNPPPDPWGGTVLLGTAGADENWIGATDGDGNLYVVGNTSGDLEGPGSQIGGEDAFLAKFDPEGGLLWSRQFGTVAMDRAWSVAVDHLGNVYVAGETAGDMDGAGLGPFGSSDGFLARFNGEGVVQWVTQFGSAAADTVWSIAVDAAGNIYLGGDTLGTIDPVNGPVGGVDAFVARYSPAGDQEWIRQFGSGNYDDAVAVAVGGGWLYATGEVGELESGTPGDTYKGNGDAYLARFNLATGNVDGGVIRQFGSAGNDYGTTLQVASDGSIFMAGYTDGVLPVSIGADSTQNIFLARVSGVATSNWPILWVEQLGSLGAGQDEPYGMALSNDAVYLAGVLGGNLPTQDNGWQGVGDAMLAKFDYSGNLSWLRLLGTAADDFAGDAVLAKDGGIFLLGTTSGDLDGELNLGGRDAFLAKYDSAGNLLP